MDIEPSYDTSTFNQCAKTQNLLLSLECWKDVHPSLVHIPLIQDYQIPYGVIINQSISPQLQNFFQIIQDSSR